MRLEGKRLRLLARLAAGILQFTAWTMRWRVEGEAPVRRLMAQGQPILLAFWHGRLAMIPYAYRRIGGRRIQILISEHRDGEFIAAAMAHWGYGAVRGSTRRGAVKGARGMLRAARAGSDLAITPDGPRGPGEAVQEGVVELARLSGLPIVPVTFAARPAWRFSSWDGFVQPFPGARGVILWDEPLWVAREADAAAVEQVRQQLEARMRAQSALADVLMERK